jgi:hypothetical protein
MVTSLSVSYLYQEISTVFATSSLDIGNSRWEGEGHAGHAGTVLHQSATLGSSVVNLGIR